MNALSKAKIAEALCNELQMNKADARDMVEHFFEELKQGLESGRHAKLSGFGNFILRDKPQRPGRNPKSGEEIPVAARRVVTFKSGLKLKTQVELRK